MSTPVGGVVPQDRWQPQQRVKVCQYQDCGAPFGFFSTKVNCHRCGIVLCSRCAATKTVIPRYYSNEAVPVCQRCYQVVERYKERGSVTPGYVVHSTTVSATPARSSPVPPLQTTQTLGPHAPSPQPASAVSPAALVRPVEALPLSTKPSVSDADLHALRSVIETLQQALKDEQRNAALDATSAAEQFRTTKEENAALKSTAHLLQQRLDTATQQRAELEAQVARLAADRDEARQQLAANAEELQQRLDTATQQRAELEAQVARLAAGRDEAVEQKAVDAEELELFHEIAAQERGAAEHRRLDLELEVERLAAGREAMLKVLAKEASKVQHRGSAVSERDVELEVEMAVLLRERDEARAEAVVAGGQLQLHRETAKKKEESFKEERSCLESRVAQLVEACAAAEQQRQEVAAKANNVQERLDAMVRRCIALEGDAERRADERDDALRQLANLREEVKLSEGAADVESAERRARRARLGEEHGKAMEVVVSGVRESQMRLEAAEEQRADVEARVARLVDEAGDLRSRLAASTDEVNLYRDLALQEHEAAQNRCTTLEAQVASLMSDRDNARQQESADLSEVRRHLDDAVQERDMAHHRCAELEEQNAAMASELQAVKAKLRQASVKASSLMTRLSASSSGASGASALVSVGSSSAVPQAAPHRDAELIAEVGERLRERGEAMRLLAEGVELRERARPLERVLAEKLIDDRRTSDAEEVATGSTQLPRNAAHSRRLDSREAQLDERAARLREKERQLLRVAHELQAKSRALQVLYARALDRPQVTSLLLTADGGDTSYPNTPQQQQQGTRTPLREPVYPLDSGVAHYDRTAGAAMSSGFASPLPREPPRARMAHRDVEATDTEEDTQERLTAATEAYRDVLYEHILESNGLQGVDALAQYLPRHTSGGGLKTPRLPASGIISKTRAMLRALEERLGASRGVVRGVDPAVQERSLEAFRRLEAALSTLCCIASPALLRHPTSIPRQHVLAAAAATPPLAAYCSPRSCNSRPRLHSKWQRSRARRRQSPARVDDARRKSSGM